MEKTILIQFIVLLGGTIFAWTNFTIELIGWLKTSSCKTCVGKSQNPFLTPCFWGALFFTLAFILNIFLLKG